MTCACYVKNYIFLHFMRLARYSTFLMESGTKNPAAVALAKLRAQKLSPERQSEIGRIAGKVGGKARAEKLTPERRSEIARKAGKAGAAKRWGKTSR